MADLLNFNQNKSSFVVLKNNKDLMTYESNLLVYKLDLKALTIK